MSTLKQLESRILNGGLQKEASKFGLLSKLWGAGKRMDDGVEVAGKGLVGLMGRHKLGTGLLGAGALEAMGGGEDSSVRNLFRGQTLGNIVNAPGGAYKGVGNAAYNAKEGARTGLIDFLGGESNIPSKGEAPAVDGLTPEEIKEFREYQKYMKAKRSAGGAAPLGYFGQ